MESKFELFKKRASGIVFAMGADPRNVSASQYQLILEADLKMGMDRVMFPAIGWRGSREFITEVRLMQQDMFVCNKWGLFLLNTDGRSDVKFEEHTYPDPQYFDKESRDEAEIFYNADLSFVVNNFIEVPAVRTDRFKVYVDVKTRRNIGIYDMVEMEDHYLVLIGSKNVYFNLDLPRKLNLNGSTMRLRLRLDGLLFQGANIIT
jgi:hypothetical protein